MSTHFEDRFIAEKEKQSAVLIASSDAALKKCDQKAEKAEKKLEKVGTSLEKTEAHLTEFKLMQSCPDVFMAAKKLPEAEFQLRCAHYMLAEERKEKEQLQARYATLNVQQVRQKKEIKELKQTFDELTVELTGEVKTTEMMEKKAMMDELASLEEQLKLKNEENKKKDEQILEMRGAMSELKEDIEAHKKKDQQIFEVRAEMSNWKEHLEGCKRKDEQILEMRIEMTELKEYVEAYQKASGEGYAKRQAANDAYTAELEEAYAAATKQSDDLQIQLDDMLEYANHAVTMANNAWRDGADTIEYLRAQKGLTVREWCVNVEGSSTLVSDSEASKSSDRIADSETNSVE